MKVIVESHNPTWRAKFDVEAKLLRQALGPSLRALHHVGSTAVPGIYAKPIVDILAEVAGIDEIDSRNTFMVEIGYEVMGEFGIPGRRYFRKDNASGFRECQVHAFEFGSRDVGRHLAFRDYLRAKPDVAHQYSELKRGLANKHPDDIEAYMDGKDAFIKEAQRLALEWRRSA